MRREFEQACRDEKVWENETECALSKGKRVQIAGEGCTGGSSPLRKTETMMPRNVWDRTYKESDS